MIIMILQNKDGYQPNIFSVTSFSKVLPADWMAGSPSSYIYCQSLLTLYNGINFDNAHSCYSIFGLVQLGCVKSNQEYCVCMKEFQHDYTVVVFVTIYYKNCPIPMNINWVWPRARLREGWNISTVIVSIVPCITQLFTMLPYNQNFLLCVVSLFLRKDIKTKSL